MKFASSTPRTMIRKIALHQRVVLGLDRGQELVGDAGVVEDDLDGDGACDDEAERKGEGGEERAGWRCGPRSG